MNQDRLRTITGTSEIGVRGNPGLSAEADPMSRDESIVARTRRRLQEIGRSQEQRRQEQDGAEMVQEVM